MKKIGQIHSPKAQPPIAGNLGFKIIPHSQATTKVHRGWSCCPGGCGLLLPPMNPTMSHPTRGRKRKKKTKTHLDDASSGKRQNVADTTIDDLPDDILISILSRVSIKAAIRTSVLSGRWRHLWKFTSGNLDFQYLCNDKNIRQASRRLNRVLKLHQAPQMNRLSVCFLFDWSKTPKPSRVIGRWICHAMKKKAKFLAIDMGFPPFNVRKGYQFPSLHKLRSPDSYDFGFLKSLKLVYVDIEDEMVHDLLASCINLEELSIKLSYSTKELRFVDPLPKLKFLEISECPNMRRLKISVASLVCASYSGDVIAVPFETMSNHTQIALGGSFAKSFLYDGNKHSTYSSELEWLKLDLTDSFDDRDEDNIPVLDHPNFPSFSSLKKLEVKTGSVVGRSLLFFTKLIKACPFLHEFKIKMEKELIFPVVNAEESPIFFHENLKVVKLDGYVGCTSEEEFLAQLLKIAPSLEVVIDTLSRDFLFPESLASTIKHNARYYPRYGKILKYAHAKSWLEAKECAEQLRLKFPPQAQLTVITDRFHNTPMSLC